LAAIVLISLLALAILYLWSKQSREKEKNRTLIIEQQLLRSQMNPHFIFNALNGIKRFYVEGKIDIANDFLADFSNLLRKILDRSNETHIHVSEEIDFLRLYLELEERRLNGALNFDLNFNEEDFNYDDKVPALILQPIVENAIWHGISGKRRGGEIKINCKKVDDQMVCEIEDNGAGFSTSEK
jgi:LytS/YehU family sensor histidine kinase